MAKRVVLKIGGGILKDKACFDKVVSVVRNKRDKGEECVIVVSALYGITDFLIGSTRKSQSSDKEISSTLNRLKDMHYSYLSFISDKKIREAAEIRLGDNISVLERFLYGIHYLKEVSPRSKDLIQSFGERLSPIVLEAFLMENKVDSKFMDAEEAGIYCKGPFENALADLEKTGLSLSSKVPRLLKKSVVLLPGYYGIDENNDVKTFGRGGTDYSAGFISNLLDADLEIWKDVSGFMTADPKVVKGAKQIDFLSYEEAEELGYLGAKILHPKTIEPLRQKGLEAEVKNLFAPEVKGTIIGPSEKKAHEILKSITARKEIAIITVSSSTMVNSSGFASLIFSRLAEKEISVDFIATSETAISFSIEPKDIDASLALLNPIKNDVPCTITLHKDLSLIGIIGEGIKETKGIAGRLFSALGKEVNAEFITQGASDVNISLVVKKQDLDKAVYLIHKEFFG